MDIWLNWQAATRGDASQVDMLLLFPSLCHIRCRGALANLSKLTFKVSTLLVQGALHYHLHLSWGRGKQLLCGLR